VGRANDEIQSRVHRHLITGRSHAAANRQFDVWEIAWVWAYPVAEREQIDALEYALIKEFDYRSPLMNGSRPRDPDSPIDVPKPAQIVQVMQDQEIAERRDLSSRFPRQIEHYSNLISHFLTVKNSNEIALVAQAHFARLRRLHSRLLDLAIEVEFDPGDD